MGDEDPYQAAANLFGDNSILDMRGDKSKVNKEILHNPSDISFSSFYENKDEIDERFVEVCVNDLVSMLDLKRDERFSPDFRFHMRKFALINYKSHNGDDVDECTVFLPEDCVNNLSRLRKELDNYAKLYISKE